MLSARRRRSVPLRYQLSATECAAACLAMVASYYGRHTLVSECRELLGLGRDGATARRLVEAAPACGLVATVDRAADPFAERLDGPVIAFLAEHHFVVVERVGRRYVRFADPTAGREMLSREEFRDRYGGVLVRVAPGPRFRPRQVRLRDALLVRYLRDFVATPGSRRVLAGIVAAAVLLQALGLAMPFTTQFAVDRMIPEQRHDLLPLLAVGVLGTAFLHGLLTLLRSRLLLALRARGDRLLTGEFVEHLLRLPLPYFLQRARGDLLMRLSSVSVTREMLTQQVLTMMLDAALLSGYVVGLAVWAPRYVGLVLCLGAAQTGVLAVSYRRIRMLARRELQAKASEQSYLVEILEAVAPVKANGIERQATVHWRELFDTYRDAMVRRGRSSSWVEAAQGMLGTLAPLALLWFGLSQVLGGTLSLGTMLAANSLAMSALTPLLAFVGSLQLFAILRAQTERIYDVLDAPEEPTGDTVPPPEAPIGVQARDLTFRYDAGGPAVVSGVSFTLRPGMKLGIVGRTGSGKSTLALLVLGLLRADRGELRLGGVPVGQLDLPEFRRGCGAVLQQLTLFNSTIRENLTLGRQDIGQADVEAAARTAGLHDDVVRLPMGYDTIVGEAGGALSAGQRQRVALARALLHRPRLLVLDEATSHLDPATERQVDEALSRLDISRIVISHRLSAVRNADEILVLDHGRVIARGRHDELIAKGGMYRDMFGPPASGPAPRAVGVAPDRHGAPNGRHRTPDLAPGLAPADSVAHRAAARRTEEDT